MKNQKNETAMRMMAQARSFLGVRVLLVDGKRVAFYERAGKLYKTVICDEDCSSGAFIANLEALMKSLIDDETRATFAMVQKLLQGTAWSMEIYGYYSVVEYDFSADPTYKAMCGGCCCYAIGMTPSAALEMIDFAQDASIRQTPLIEMSKYPSFIKW